MLWRTAHRKLTFLPKSWIIHTSASKNYPLYNWGIANLIALCLFESLERRNDVMPFKFKNVKALDISYHNSHRLNQKPFVQFATWSSRRDCRKVGIWWSWTHLLRYFGNFKRSIYLHAQQLRILQGVEDRAGEGCALGSLGRSRTYQFR